MSTSSLLGGSERFVSRSDVQKALSDIEMSVAGLNDELSFISPNYDSLVVFSHEQDDRVAAAVGHLDAYDIAPNRLYFRNDTVIRRRLILGGTALGETLLSPAHKKDALSTSYFAQSQINHESPQFTHIRRLFHDGTQVGAIQSSFTPESPRHAIEHIPDAPEIDAIWKRNQSEVAHVAKHLFDLQKLGHETGASLAAGLEFEDPIVPNAYLVRWDLEHSTPKALGDRHPALRAYLNQAHQFVRELTQYYADNPGHSTFGIREPYDDQGDGAYVILPLPKGFNVYDPKVLENYQTYTAPRFMNELAAGLEAIGSQYVLELYPKVHVSGDFGYVEGNSIGRLNSRTMYSLAEKQKQK